MINEKPKRDSEENYDPKKREPQFAHAFASPLWELVSDDSLSCLEDFAHPDCRHHF